MIVSFVSLLVLTFSAVDFGVPPDARTRSAEALEAAREGRLGEAIQLWEGLLDEVQGQARWDIHGNLAVAYRRLARPAAAWHHLWIFTEHTATGRDDALNDLRLLEQELRGDSLRVHISCNPATARVRPAPGSEGAFPVPPRAGFSCPFSGWFLPGRVTVEILASGFILREESIEIAGSAPVHLDVILEPEDQPAAPVEASEELAPIETPPPARPGAWWPWATLGGTAVAAAGGAALYFLARDNLQRINQRYPDGTPSAPVPASTEDAYLRAFDRRVKPLQAGAWASWGVAVGLAVATVTGLVLDREEESPRAGARLAPFPVSDGGGLLLGVEF